MKKQFCGSFGQGSVEYLLIFAGAIFIGILVMALLTNIAGGAKSELLIVGGDLLCSTKSVLSCDGQTVGLLGSEFNCKVNQLNRRCTVERPVLVVNDFCGNTVCETSETPVICPVDCKLGGAETCGNHVDDDFDLLLDCADPDCPDGSACAVASACFDGGCTACTDSDNDSFSLQGGVCGPLDCNDSNPQANPNGFEVCDGIDNNCDGVTDPECTAEQSRFVCESSGHSWAGLGGAFNCCGNNPNEANPFEPNELSCSDSHDNDCDGHTDALDSDCSCNISPLVLGDFSCDGVVDYRDVEAMIPFWGTNSAVFDLDGSGAVDVGDLELMRENYLMAFDLDNDGLAGNLDIAFIEPLFGKRLWGNDGFEPIADLFLDGVINSIDYSFLIGQIPVTTLGKRAVHKNQLLNTWVNKKEIIDIEKPITRLSDFTMHWSIAGLMRAEEGSGTGYTRQQAAAIFKSQSKDSFILRYVPAMELWRNATSPYTIWLDASTANQNESWYMHYNTNGIEAVCNKPYASGDRKFGNCVNYPAGTQQFMFPASPSFSSWAAQQLSELFVPNKPPYDYFSQELSDSHQGVSFDNFFYGLNRIDDTDYGVPKGSTDFAAINQSAAQWREIMKKYAGEIRKSLNKNGYKLIPNIGSHENPAPYNYVDGLLPFVDGVLDEDIFTFSNWTAGSASSGFIESLLDNYEKTIQKKKILLLIATPGQGNRGDTTFKRNHDLTNPAEFKGAIQEFYYSYAIFHMVKEPGLVYFDNSWGGFNDYPFWIKDFEITGLGKPLGKRVALGTANNSIAEFPNRHFIFSRDFENGKVFVRDTKGPDGDLFTINLSPDKTWFDRFGNTVTQVSLKPFDGKFVYTFNPSNTILDLDLNGQVDCTDRGIVASKLGQVFKKDIAAGSTYELSYDLTLDGKIDAVDLAPFGFLGCLSG